MKTIRVLHLIREEMDYFYGPENFFCKHLREKREMDQMIINIRMNTEGMKSTQKNSFLKGDLPQPWFPKKIDPGSKIYFHYNGYLVAFGTVEKTIISYPNGNPRNIWNLSEEDSHLYPFSFKIQKGTLECWNHEDLPWDKWIPIIRKSGKSPNHRAYIKLSPEQDAEIMKLIPENKVCSL